MTCFRQNSSQSERITGPAEAV